jgi:tRNA (cytidine/uridine-2'-O-)-methyltransferase
VFDVVLYQPEIPPNSGNVIRMTANTGARLHLIEPLGYTLNDRTLARAGLDYIRLADIRVHPDWPSARAALSAQRVFAMTTRGTRRHADVAFRPGDAFLFGPESRGLPQEILDEFDPAACLRIPMRPDNRSINLSNAVAVVVYEAWRQIDFAGGQ